MPTTHVPISRQTLADAESALNTAIQGGQFIPFLGAAASSWEEPSADCTIEECQCPRARACTADANALRSHVSKLLRGVNPDLAENLNKDVARILSSLKNGGAQKKRSKGSPDIERKERRSTDRRSWLELGALIALLAAIGLRVSGNLTEHEIATGPDLKKHDRKINKRVEAAYRNFAKWLAKKAHDARVPDEFEELRRQCESFAASIHQSRKSDKAGISIAQTARCLDALMFLLRGNTKRLPTTKEMAFQLSLGVHGACRESYPQVAQAFESYGELVNCVKKMVAVEKEAPPAPSRLHRSIARAVLLAREVLGFDGTNRTGAAPSAYPDALLPRLPAVFTTNWDSQIEAAFAEVVAKPGFYTVLYPILLAYDDLGTRVHWALSVTCVNEDGKPKTLDPILLPADEDRAEARLRAEAKGPVIVKLHGDPAGSLEFEHPKGSSGPKHFLVLSESTYLHASLQHYLPRCIRALLGQNASPEESASLWFIGHSISDWNLRLLLHRIVLQAQGMRAYSRWSLDSRLVRKTRFFLADKSPDVFDGSLFANLDIKVTKGCLFEFVKVLEASLKKGEAAPSGSGNGSKTTVDSLPGTRAYKISQWRSFVGRRDTIDQLETMLNGRHRILVVTGTSGVGKTSLLRAGLLPRLVLRQAHLKDPTPPVVLVFRDWSEATEERKRISLSVADAKRHASELFKVFNSVAHLERNLRVRRMCLEDLEADDFVTEYLGGRFECPVIIVLDQLEELLRDPSLREPLMKTVEHLHSRCPKPKIVLSLRSEAYASLLPLERLVGDLRAATCVLEKPEEGRELNLIANHLFSDEPDGTRVASFLQLREDAPQTLLAFQATRELAIQRKWQGDKSNICWQDVAERLTAEFDSLPARKTDPSGQDPKAPDNWQEVLLLKLRAELDQLHNRIPESAAKLFESIKKKELFFGLLVRWMILEVAPHLVAGHHDHKVSWGYKQLRMKVCSDLERNVKEYERNVKSHEEPERARDLDCRSGLATKLKLDLTCEEIEKVHGVVFASAIATLQRAGFLRGDAEDHPDRKHENEIVELSHDLLGQTLLDWAQTESQYTWAEHRVRLVDFPPANVKAKPAGAKPGSDIQTPSGRVECVRWRNGWMGSEDEKELLVSNVVFADCSFLSTAFTRCHFQKVIFRRCDLRSTIFVGCAFERVTFRDCNLSGTVFRDCKLGTSSAEGFGELRIEKTPDSKVCEALGLGFIRGGATALTFKGLPLPHLRFENVTVNRQNAVRFENARIRSAAFLFEESPSRESSGTIDLGDDLEMTFVASKSALKKGRPIGEVTAKGVRGLDAERVKDYLRAPRLPLS